MCYYGFGRKVKLLRVVVRQRAQHLNRSSEMVTDLGLPLRPRPEPTASVPQPATTKQSTNRPTKNWDVFIFHASVDKEEIARPLFDALKKAGLEVWFDEATLKLGDSLRAKIDEGLAHSRYGVVILSNRFFEKHWPQQELNGLATREVNGHKVILPIWHNIDHDQIATYSPTLADRFAVKSSRGLDELVREILSAVR